MNVKFLSVKLKATFDALQTKESTALYWIEETQELYKGSTLFGTGALATEKAAGLLSAEDKAKLDALVASGGGLKNLSAVDGTINITDTADGGKAIGVLISQDANNALRAVDGGLFVPNTVVPEYSIEKQSVATEGFSATYKLKKTVGEETVYVGDDINIAKDLVLKAATMQTVTEANVPFEGAKIGDPFIDMEFNDAASTHLYIPMKGLVDTYTAGDGIEIVENKISIKLAANSHGLVAVDGALSINLATKTSDGAMSKEDKAKLDAIPSVYVARKYDISDVPAGTLVNYGEHEIRVMCPENAEFSKQNVGAGGDANSYYLTFKTYVPNDNVVGYIEHLGDKVDAEILTDIKTDGYGRRYQPTWLALAKYDEATSQWTYYGKSSSVDKYVGWDYQIDWYDANGVMIASDSIRINLSNEACHANNKPYYMANVATNAVIEEIKASVAELENSSMWAEM